MLAHAWSFYKRDKDQVLLKHLCFKSAMKRVIKSKGFIAFAVCSFLLLAAFTIMVFVGYFQLNWYVLKEPAV